MSGIELPLPEETGGCCAEVGRVSSWESCIKQGQTENERVIIIQEQHYTLGCYSHPFIHTCICTHVKERTK